MNESFVSATGVLERVLKTISRYSMLPPGSRVVAAVSGGADSVCLLHVLHQIGISITGVAHFNHNLRGEASEEDERFVAALAARMGIPFYRAEARVSEARDNLEQAARRARRVFFAGLLRDGAGDRVALGHTRDDQAETVLFRMLRGSGLAGLAGIHPTTAEGFVRPLIEVTRPEVEDYLRARNLTWREDATNRDSRFARNRIRHGLLPQLERDWNPRIGEALAHLANVAYEEERWWAGQLPDLLTETAGGIELEAEKLAELPRAVARRVVRRAVAQAKGDLRQIEFHHIEGIIDMGAGRLRLPGVEVTRSFEWIRIAMPGAAAPGVVPIEVTVPGTYTAPDGMGEIRLEVDETLWPACANLKTELAARIELRTWRPGDRYHPVGKSRDQKVKEMFQNARVPSWRRRLWPILEGDGKILWARQFGAAQGAGIRVSEIERAGCSIE